MINTSRGGIVNEKALYYALKNKKLFSAAMDVFIKEPYKGKLKKLKNCLLTSHMSQCQKIAVLEWKLRQQKRQLD